MKGALRILAAVACLSASAHLAASDTAGLAATLERFDHLQVGSAVGVTGLRLTAGHTVCMLASGRAAQVKAGGEVVGLFFEGAGEIEYLSVDPIEAPAVIFNAKKASRLKPEKIDHGVRLHETIKNVLWLSRGQPAPAFTGAAATALTDAFEKHREKYRHLTGPPASYDFAMQELDAPEAPLVRAEIEGGDDDLLYELRGFDDPTEELGVLESEQSNDPEIRKNLYFVGLSEQRTARDPRDPPKPRVVLAHLDVDLLASDGNDAKLTVVETIVPIGRPLAVLRLDLRSKFYLHVGNNLATRSERLRKVTDEAGRSLAFDHAGGQVVVRLAEPAAPDRPIQLRFDIDGDFLVRPGGDSYWELGTTSWFPQPSLAGQFYTFHGVVRVQKPFVPFAPGKTIRRAAEGGENVVETQIDKPVCFLVILAGKYEFEEDVRHGITIRVATYALKNARAVKQLTNLAEAIIGYYEQFLGPFPMPEFNIIEINNFGFGQAPPGTMFITKEAFNPLLDEENQFFSQGINERFAHEIAHQYWGTAVKMPSDEEQWLTESFAEYCAGLFLKMSKNEATFKKLSRHWRTRANFATDAAPIPLANRVRVANDATTTFAIRTGLLYDKGPVLLEALHKELGDDAFLTFLKSYQKSFAWKFGSTKTLAGLLQYMTKKDYMPFFDKYYWGTEMPKD